MPREIVLDTETTGLDPRQGHRVIEIACLELEDFLPTGRHFHCYIDPQRDIDPEAQRVHGLSRDFLTDKPPFAHESVAAAFLDFIASAPLIAHNASFDRGFINHELTRAGHPTVADERWVDTLALAQSRYPGMHNSLDALCKRFKISLAEREKHGALIDTQLLAAVYLELRGGRERRLDLTPEALTIGVAQAVAQATYAARPRSLADRLTQEERAAHEAFVASEIKGGGMWSRLDGRS